MHLHVSSELQHALAAADLPTAEGASISARLGEAGGWVEADARLVHQLAHSPAPPVTRALVLLRMASGEAAPRGPAAERARVELFRLLRAPELHRDAGEHPESFRRLRDLLSVSALAA